MIIIIVFNLERGVRGGGRINASVTGALVPCDGCIYPGCVCLKKTGIMGGGREGKKEREFLKNS